MLRQFLEGTPLFSLPLIAMGIFVAMFLAVLVRASQKSRRGEYSRMADLPLQHDSEGGERS